MAIPWIWYVTIRQTQGWQLISAVVSADLWNNSAWKSKYPEAKSCGLLTVKKTWRGRLEVRAGTLNVPTRNLGVFRGRLRKPHSDHWFVAMSTRMALVSGCVVIESDPKAREPFA